MKKKKQQGSCESCMYYEYDEDYECYVCEVNLDEDEMARFMEDRFYDCPYYRLGDEYMIVRNRCKMSWRATNDEKQKFLDSAFTASGRNCVWRFSGGGDQKHQPAVLAEFRTVLRLRHSARTESRGTGHHLLD